MAESLARARRHASEQSWLNISSQNGPTTCTYEARAPDKGWYHVEFAPNNSKKNRDDRRSTSTRVGSTAAACLVRMMRLARPSTVLRIGRSVRTARAAHISLLRVPRLALRSRVCSTSSKEASESLAERAQIDSGFWQGLAVLGGIAALAATPEATKRSAALSAVARYRRLGLDPILVSDRRLIDDFLRTNIVALGNVLLASPTFYFMWHLIHQQSVATSLMRSVTGSVRIVPFMVVFHACFAVGLPFFTAELMKRSSPGPADSEEDNEKSYLESKSNAATYMLLTGFVAIEAMVELRGCGVAFNQMPASGFTLFIPALIGRLATGALTQYQKIGEEFVNILPAAWGASDAPAWQRSSSDLCNYMCIDEAFMYTLFGTSFFQHVLNGASPFFSLSLSPRPKRLLPTLHARSHSPPSLPPPFLHLRHHLHHADQGKGGEGSRLRWLPRIRSRRHAALRPAAVRAHAHDALCVLHYVELALIPAPPP